MFAFIIYELKVAAVMAAFYLCFKLLLSHENLHRLNRAVLLSTTVLSFVLPLCIITLHKTLPAPEVFATMVLEEAAPSLDAVSGSGNPGSGWKAVVIAAYWMGVIAVLSSIVTGIVRVMKLIRNGERKELNGSEVIVCRRDIAPFSWMKWIVMCNGDFESGNNHILEHEKAHIRLGHSKDVLLVDVLSAFQWFNPAIWLLKMDLRDVHEYEADDAVLRTGADIREYQYSLIRKAVSANGYFITNSFNHSILKNRITMMSKSKVSWMRGLRALYILPLLCGALALNARTVIDYESSEIQLNRQASDIKIEIRLENKKPVYYVDGEKTSLEKLAGKVAGLIKEAEYSTVSISCDDGVEMGAVTDLKNELRKANALKVLYSGRRESGQSDPVRRLAPAPETGMVMNAEEVVKSIPKDHHYPLKINAKNYILFHNAPVAPEKLYSSIVEVLENDHNAVIVLQNDLKTSYDTYRKVQSDIMLAVAAARESYARTTYGKSMDDLDENQNAAVLKEIPLCLVEIESRNNGRL